MPEIYGGWNNVGVHMVFLGMGIRWRCVACEVWWTSSVDQHCWSCGNLGEQATTAVWAGIGSSGHHYDASRTSAILNGEYIVVEHDGENDGGFI